MERVRPLRGDARVIDPNYTGTANQRPANDPLYPIGQEYASGFRGKRIYERLDERLEGDRPVDRAFMESLQRDTLDIRARKLVPALLDARERTSEAADPWLDAITEWDYRMDRDSEAALAFDRFYAAFREATWGEDFGALGLEGDDWWPQEWVLASLPPDDEFFGGDRAAVLADAMDRAVSRLEREELETYGEANRTTIDHQFGEQVPALNYPRYPADGTAYTVFNVHDGAEAGSSWRQVSPMDGDSMSIIPGGQSGSYFSECYHDQLEAWANDEYKPMAFETPDEEASITFREEE